MTRAEIEARGYDLKAVNPNAKTERGHADARGTARHHRGQGARGFTGSRGAAGAAVVAEACLVLRSARLRAWRQRRHRRECALRPVLPWHTGRPRSGFTGTTLQLTLLNAAMVVKGTALMPITNDGAYGYGDFLDVDGGEVVPLTGDHIRGSVVGANGSFVDITVPAVAVAGVAKTDVITETCGVAADYWVELTAPDWTNDYTFGAHIAAGKSYSRDITAHRDLLRGDVLRLSCDLASGDTAMRDSFVP